MASGKITIKEIAQKAGVSSASVSMILNGKNLSRFSEETVTQVKQIAFAHNYQLKHPKAPSGTIMIICPSVMNPYYATLIQSMEQEAIDKGYRTSIFTTYWSTELEKQALELAMSSAQYSGIIFSMIPQQPELAVKASKKLPVVAVGDRLQDLGIDTVDVNNYYGGEMIGKHLLELGHKNIAYISTALNAEHSARVKRCDGLRAVYHTPPIKGHVSIYATDISSATELNTTQIEYEVGFQLAQKCVRENPDVTALVAVNDMVAYGVIDGVHDLGLRVPEDISVCGFDNIFPSRFSGIRLTTIDHSIEERGRSTFRLLTERLNNPEIAVREGGITRVEYKSRLIVRESSGVVKERQKS